MAYAGSLCWQPSLLDVAYGAPSFDAAFTRARRLDLEPGAWVEHAPQWVRGGDALFADIVERAPWHQGRRYMYDRMVDEPRLTAWYGTALNDDAIPPVVADMARTLSERYRRDFDSVGAALYRDGHDSVAWHGDKIPEEVVEPVVAIVSLGSARKLRMRAKFNHRNTRSFTLLPGDLLVMGGTSQRTWEHSIPKVRFAGPRLSVQFRHD
ncbi:MAG TPA: alpha-ketoglutarate-dependent dioxygenase AlkB [Acidimicrobiia bacterium]|nr:alpha-ketoglutarate-dependent dioxygenase AlkB [Acidimicrobiia bacterium]